MPTAKPELECLACGRTPTEAGVRTAVQAVAAKRKRTNVVQQQLEAMQKTIDGLQSEMEFAVLRAKDAL